MNSGVLDWRMFSEKYWGAGSLIQVNIRKGQ